MEEGKRRDGGSKGGIEQGSREEMEEWRKKGCCYLLK